MAEGYLEKVYTDKNDPLVLKNLLLSGGYTTIPVMGDPDFYQVQMFRIHKEALEEAVNFMPSVVPLLPHVFPHLPKDAQDKMILGNARGLLKQTGVDKPCWQFIAGLSPQVTKYIANVNGGMDGSSLRAVSCRFTVLAQGGVITKVPQVLDRVIQSNLLDHYYSKEVSDSLAAVVKRAFETADSLIADKQTRVGKLKMKGGYTEYMTQLGTVMEWFEQVMPTFDRNMKTQGTWKNFAAKAKVWADEREAEARRLMEEAAAQAAKVKNLSWKNCLESLCWKTLIDKQEINGYTVMPMVVAKNQLDLGDELNCCLGRWYGGAVGREQMNMGALTYLRTAMTGHGMIFAILEKGNSRRNSNFRVLEGYRAVSALEINIPSVGGVLKECSVGQNRGYSNGAVTGEIDRVADRVLELVQAAVNKKTQAILPTWAMDQVKLARVADAKKKPVALEFVKAPEPGDE